VAPRYYSIHLILKLFWNKPALVIQIKYLQKPEYWMNKLGSQTWITKQPCMLLVTHVKQLKASKWPDWYMMMSPNVPKFWKRGNSCCMCGALSLRILMTFLALQVWRIVTSHPTITLSRGADYIRRFLM
jgi:hypothetical protein